jgi:microcystin-dependent protein
MPEPVTTRMSLPAPSGTDPANVPVDIDKLRKQIDLLSAIYGQGTTAARPAAGIAGRLYFSTDEAVLYYDDGTTWRSPVTPPGTLRLYASAAAAAGWLLCDGSAYSRAEYSALFGVIGTAWGAGDGTSTFNVPDLRGRAPIGAGTGAGLTARTVGGKGGEEAHILVVAEMPSHNHTVRKTVQAFQNGPVNARMLGESQTYQNEISWDSEYITPVGGGGTHNNMQPFAVVNYLIKT